MQYNLAYMLRSFWLTVFVGVIVLMPRPSLALPPPDLIVNIGSQFAQVFSLLAVLLSASAGLVLQHFRRVINKIKGHNVWIGLAAFTVVVLALVFTGAIFSWVQVLNQARYEQEVAETIQNGIAEHDIVPNNASPDAFFEANRDLPIVINNEEFDSVRASTIFVLDAREDEEYDLGHYEPSTHVRFADLLAGAWVDLPTDRVVYVLCWSGIRGQEVAEFLRTKGIVARYLEDGAKGWVDYGGAWEGEILFSTTYYAERYTGTLSTAQVHDYVSEGAVLVDARRPDAFATGRIENSLNITTFFTPTDQFAELFAQVPVQSEVIVICDDYMSCFDAKIVGIKLEKLGHTFLGRYNEPSAY